MSSKVTTETSRSAAVLPAWTSVLAVVAHPDDESFALGAILDAFIRAGARVEVLCLTHGEASTLHGVPGELASLREAELAAAAAALGVTHTTLHHHADGALSELCQTSLATEVVDAAESSRADGLLVFDTSGVTGHLDHVAATSAGLLAAETLNLPVLGWTLPETVGAQLNQEFDASFTGHRDEDIDLRVTVDRARQHVASHAHASQALPGSVLWRRLELLGDTESLRWLWPPGEHKTYSDAPTGAAPNRGRVSAMLRSALADWSRRRRVAVLVLTPVMAATFVAVSGTPVGHASAAWLLLVAVAAAVAAAVLGSYLPRKGLRLELGCTPCAAMSAMTVVGAMVALNNYGPMLVGPALAIAVTLFGLTQRLSQTETCSVPARANMPDGD